MAEITLLDGGMGQELIARSGDNPGALWATRVMIDHPGMVQAIHTDYFNAGATIATLNTYAIHHDRLLGFGLDDQFENEEKNDENQRESQELMLRESDKPQKDSCQGKIFCFEAANFFQKPGRLRFPTLPVFIRIIRK